MHAVAKAKEAAAAAKEKAAAAAEAAKVKAAAATVAAKVKAAAATVAAKGTAATVTEAAKVKAAAAQQNLSEKKEQGKALAKTTIGQPFDEPDEAFAPDALGPRLLCFDSYASSDVKRWWELANRAYEVDPTPWAQIGSDPQRNLKLIALAFDGQIELGFRGSVFKTDDGQRHLANWHRINANAGPVELSPEFGFDDAPEGTLVHKGYQEAYLSLRPQLLAWIEKQGGIGSIKRCVICGHSLGGALATFCAADLGHLGGATELITWGGPRIGNAGFVELYHRGAPGGRFATTARFVNGLDVIPRGVPAPGFRHLCPPSLLAAAVATPDDLAALTELTDEAGALSVEDSAGGDGADLAEGSLSAKAGAWLKSKADAAGKRVALTKEAAAKRAALAKKSVEDHLMSNIEEQLKQFEGRPAGA